MLGSLALAGAGGFPLTGTPAPGPGPAARSAAAGVSAGVFRIDPPASPGAFAPDLVVDGGELLATWLEPRPAAAGAAGHRLRFARLRDGAWSEPVTVAAGGAFFANWADFPGVAVAGGGTLYVHWLEKTGEGAYAYGVRLARSTDGGRSWETIGSLHDDSSPTEHGFVSWAPAPAGLQAFWLDGRAMGEGGPMSLRARRLTAGGREREHLLDPRVCECCQTGAALTRRGPVVVYRDRSTDEVRDIAIVRETGDGFTAPTLVHRDGWKIAGCPVNGPAVDADGDRVAVAWFTGAGGRPRVLVAFSADSGATFGPPLLVDGGRPLGRVDVALGPAGAAVSWLAAAGGEARVMLRYAAPGGGIGDPLSVAATSQARASGFPRLTRIGERLLLLWVEAGGEGPDRSPDRIRAAELPLAALPAVS